MIFFGEVGGQSQRTIFMPIFSLKITAEKSADFGGFFYGKPQPNAPLKSERKSAGQSV